MGEQGGHSPASRVVDAHVALCRCVWACGEEPGGIGLLREGGVRREKGPVQGPPALCSTG
jgi:hypothetical protein